ncbi:lysosomal proton-coupled steroid conjugate and bile acid symporter SLC46A3-like [Rhopilema esculentum]|uniref:lysosomal proton-coupled steroid conjugate and bile acid symporter SLC46A3-like n=1 Tax=Rhopilema esculentum TaxID=499914 RepID=UPI0031DBAE71|eukprot:gene1995-17550_t
MGCFRPTAEPFYAMSVFTFAFNVIVLPQLVQDTVCKNKYNRTVCGDLGSYHNMENDVQKEAAYWMSYFPVTSLLPALFTIFMIGSISDFIGKRRTMLVPPFIYCIQSVLFVVLIAAVKPNSPGLYLIPYCLPGLFGENAGVAALSEAYISSITRADQRTLRLSILESCLFLGALFAALLSGFVLHYFGFVGGFSMTAIVNFLNFLYVVFLLPDESALLPEPEERLVTEEGQESDTTENCQGHHEEQQRHSFNPFVLYQRISAVICKENRRKKMSFVFALFGIALFVNMGEVYMGMLYIKHSPFSMTPRDIGYFNTAQAFLRAFGVIVVPYIFINFLRLKDMGLIIFGFFIQIVYFITLGVSVSRLMLYLIQIIAIPVAAHLPALRSMITKFVDPHEYGSAVAAAEAIDVASSLLTSYISNQIYSETVYIFPGFAMCLLGIVAFIGFLAAIVYFYCYERAKSNDSEQELLLS